MIRYILAALLILSSTAAFAGTPGRNDASPPASGGDHTATPGRNDK